MMESSQGLTAEQAVRLMTRLMNLADILVFTSAVNLADLENEKNMSNGGILRQCLRLGAPITHFRHISCDDVIAFYVIILLCSVYVCRAQLSRVSSTSPS